MNVLLLITLKSEKRINKNILLETERLKNVESKFLYSLRNNNEYFPLDINLVTLNGKLLHLLDTLHSETLILWYPQHSCTLCFKENLEYFLRVSEYFENAFIISTHLSVRDLFFFRKKYNINLPCFVVKQTECNYLFKDRKDPLFFVLDLEGKVNSVLEHDADLSEISRLYFEQLERGRRFDW